MSSFVTSLQYYIVFEVLEPNWAKLEAALPKAADMDAVITLHEDTLQVHCECTPPPSLHLCHLYMIIHALIPVCIRVAHEKHHVSP